MDESSLPSPFCDALTCLRSGRMPGARLDAVQDNWAYVWLPEVRVDQGVYPPPELRGLWVRLPIQFPHANPHGVVSIERLSPKDHHVVKGENENHDTARPVASLGGRFYYSWTWGGELGTATPLASPTDILEVISWVERRIRIA